MEEIEGGAKGYYNDTDKRIAILAGMSEMQTIKTIIHEMAHTDGVPEATNAEDKQFGTDRTEAALNIKAEADPKEILKIVRASVDEFVGNAEQYDDLTMVCLEYKGVPEQGEDAAE
jgi:hypothetical protein